MTDTVADEGVDAEQVRYTIVDAGACAVLTVGGRIDSQKCPDVCGALLAASGDASGLVVDLSRAEFGQAGAAGLFVRSLQRSRRRASSVCVVAAPEPVGWLLGFSAQTAEIATCTSLTEALAMVSRARRAPSPH